MRAAVVPLLALVAVPAAVAARLGSDGGGVFAAAWSVAVVLGVLVAVVVWRSVRTTTSDLRTALERALLPAVPLVVVVLIGSPWILTAFGRHARDTGVGSLVLLALATVPFAVVTIASRSAAVAGRQGAALAFPAVALVVALALGWVSMPVVGVLGAAFAWLAGQTVVAVSVLLRTRSMITQPVA
ncbi:hypothetical protein [Pseudonocardia endophytica]|uniref:Polysaccharide biosynthesis protein n=1 Tax=Pseudonocardia endophytica TaxID=401976 RepID=A0A4R1HWC5_PSEEN|nr:hypothetical protein [Pseudonocardia endophytica]TCK24289.1 hypothetical protein EV378_0061 [Pseudonocardia endophytica]